MNIRPMRESEYTLLSEFLYEAIFQRDGDSPLPRTVIQDPSVWIYIDGFGEKPDDRCLVAEENGYIVGAVWVRCVRGFGYIDDETPEFAISVYPKYRGRGIGAALMRAMLALLREKGYARSSLAVQKDNYAVSLYQSVGFSIIGENDQEYIMLHA